MTDINDIIRSMSEAKAAMERVPELTKDNETLAATVAQLEATRKQHEDRIAELELNFEQSQKDLAEKAEAHKAATFRENEVRSRLETFQQLVSGALQQVNPAVEDTINPSQPALDHDDPQHPNYEYTHGLSAVPLPEGSSSASSQASPATTETAPHTAAPAEPWHAPSLPPYLNLPDWRKPHELTWGEWRKGGGEAPSWVSDLDH